MCIKKNLRKFIIAVLAVEAVIITPSIYKIDCLDSLRLVSVANAEIKTYEGTGSFAVVNETLEQAKKEAKLNAERHIAEEVYADLQTESISEDGKLKHDEIILMTEGVMRIIDVKYQIKSSTDDSFIVIANVTAEVDTEEVYKLLKQRIID